MIGGQDYTIENKEWISAVDDKPASLSELTNDAFKSDHWENPYLPIGPEIPNDPSHENKVNHIETSEKDLPGKGEKICQSKFVGMDVFRTNI